MGGWRFPLFVSALCHLAFGACEQNSMTQTHSDLADGGNDSRHDVWGEMAPDYTEPDGSPATPGGHVSGVGGVTVGQQRLVVILVNETGSPPPTSFDTAQRVLEDVAAWFEEASYGRMWVEFDMAGWYDLPGASVLKEQEIFEAALADGVVFQDGDRILFAFAGGSGGGGSTAGQNELTIGSGDSAYTIHASRACVSAFGDSDSTRSTIIHEIGHGLGLPHADSMSSINGEEYGYGSSVDPMGRGNAHYNADYKEMLGWLDEEDILWVSQSGTYTLRALTSQEGIRCIRIPIDPNHYLSLETRRAFAHDQPLQYNTADGVLIHWVRPESASSPYLRKALTLDATWETPNHSSADFALMPGRTFNVPEQGLYVTVLAVGEDETNIHINLDTGEQNQAPLIDGVTAIEENDGVFSFTVDAYEPDGDSIVVFWSFEPTAGRDSSWYYLPGSYGSGTTAHHTFAGDSQRRVQVVVSDMRGGETWGWVDVAGYQNQAPVIDTIVVEGEALIGFSFATVVDDADLLTYHWDFGDSFESYLPEPYHAYSEPGIYSVTLTVSDRELSDMTTIQIESIPLDNVAPTANAGADIVVAIGDTVTLDGSASTDPDQYPAPLELTWEPPDNLTFPEDFIATRPTLTFTAPDYPESYTFVLRVTDGQLEATDAVIVTVLGD